MEWGGTAPCSQGGSGGCCFHLFEAIKGRFDPQELPNTAPSSPPGTYRRTRGSEALLTPLTHIQAYVGYPFRGRDTKYRRDYKPPMQQVDLMPISMKGKTTYTMLKYGRPNPDENPVGVMGFANPVGWPRGRGHVAPRVLRTSERKMRRTYGRGLFRGARWISDYGRRI